jgi:hypothetical protein
MLEIHCHRCGGFIGNPAGTMYREAPMGAPPVVPHSGLCVCGAATVYGPAPEGAGRGQSGVHRIRSASRN